MTAAEVALDSEGLLDILGFTDDEFTSVIHWIGDGAPSTWVGLPSLAPAYAASLPETANVFFGVNPTKGPARRNAGRGGDDDITRLADLPLDLDISEGKCPSRDVALAIIAELGIILGTRCSVIVDSGHGVHAHWPIEDGHVIDGDIGPRRALLKRWGRLVAVVAGAHKVHCDNVFDPARMMRLPGSHNNKNVDGEKPPLVTARTQPGGPLNMAEVTERLDEAGVPERDDDGAVVSQEEVSSPDGWLFAERTCGYAAQMINAWATDRPKAGAGRNPLVYNQHIRLFCALRYGCLTADDYQRGRQVLVDLLTTLVTTTDPRRAVKRFELADMNKHGIAKVACKTDEQVRAELGGHVHGKTAKKNPPASVDLEWFWELTSTLRHVRDFAHARLVGPWAVLGVLLARVVAVVPPTVQLPAWVGGNASLNLFVGLVGVSGDGKGGPEKTAKEAFRLGPVYTTGIGSGQGINHLFAHYDSKARTTVMARWSVYFSVPEVDTIGSERGRTGSNLLPQLRKAWDGSDLTFAYADRTKAIVVDAHAYRLVAVVGVQPNRAATLLNDVDAGTPQRYLWLPAHAPNTPMEDVEAPEQIDLTAITEGWPAPQMDLAARLIAANEGQVVEQVRLLKFPDAAREEIRTNRKRKNRGESTDPALDGHLGLCRMKAAAALALLHGERKVTPQFWEMSEVLMAMSQATRASVERQLAEKERVVNRARGRAQGERAVVAEEVKYDADVKRVAQTLLRWLNKHGGGTYALVRRDGCAGRDKKLYFDAALDRLVEAGSVVVVDGEIKLAATC